MEIEKNYIIVDVSEEPKGFQDYQLMAKPNEEKYVNSIHEADDAILTISSGLIKR